MITAYDNIECFMYDFKIYFHFNLFIFQWRKCKMPSIDTQSIRVPGEMDRCPSHISDATSRHAGCRSALDVSSTLESSPVARDSFATCCDASNITNAVLFEKDIVTTLEDELSSVARLSQNISLSHNARSVDLYSSQKEFECPATPCDRGHDTSIMNHRNRHSSTRRSDAMRYSHVADVFSITRYGFNQILGLMMTDWITNSSWRRWRIYFPFLICLFCATQCTARTCAVGLSTPGCKFRSNMSLHINIIDERIYNTFC